MDPIIARGVAESPFPNTYSTAILDALKVIKAHIPSVTDEMDAGEGEYADLWPRDDMGDYIGDQRICACGRRIDGFYDYVDHLKEVLS
jgi:hypothetical protein